MLIIGSYDGHCGYQVATKLAHAGYALHALPFPGLSPGALTWDDVKSYNAIVVMGLGESNADMTLSSATRQTIATLRRFLEAGGGVLMLGSFGEVTSTKPAQDAFLKPFGLTPLFDEAITDPDNTITATAWKIPFARATVAAPSPVTAGVK